MINLIIELANTDDKAVLKKKVTLLQVSSVSSRDGVIKLVSSGRACYGLDRQYGYQLSLSERF